MNRVCFSSSTEGWTFLLHADLAHSAHCAADRVLGDGCLASVVVQRQVPWLGRAETVEFRSCRFSGVRNAWFDYGYMFCIIQGGFWMNFHDFLRDWEDSDPEVILVVHCTHGR